MTSKVGDVSDREWLSYLHLSMIALLYALVAVVERTATLTMKFGPYSLLHKTFKRDSVTLLKL